MGDNLKIKYQFIIGPVRDQESDGEKKEAQAAEVFHVQYDKVVFGNTLFKNLGGGKFREVSDKAGMETFWPWGIGAGDFDNDGRGHLHSFGHGRPWLLAQRPDDEQPLFCTSPTAPRNSASIRCPTANTATRSPTSRERVRRAVSRSAISTTTAGSTW